jgi:hypothetical protein
MLGQTGCISVETGPATEEQQRRHSNVQASDVTHDWSERFRQAEAHERGFVVKMLIDSVSAHYFRYGRRVADDWISRNESSPAQVSAETVREGMQRSNESLEPVFRAYEEVIEFTITEMKRDGPYNQPTFELLDSFADQFYKVYSSVFFPRGSARDYVDILEDSRAETESISQNLAEELERYR